MRKAVLPFVVACVLLAAGAVPVYAHVRVGVGIAVPVWGPWWGYPAYPYPYYGYGSQPVVIQQQPSVYEEQAPQQEQQQSYWYYCQESKTYYPYVKQCPGGWLKVVPAPAPPQ